MLGFQLNLSYFAIMLVRGKSWDTPTCSVLGWSRWDVHSEGGGWYNGGWALEHVVPRLSERRLGLI